MSQPPDRSIEWASFSMSLLLFGQSPSLSIERMSSGQLRRLAVAAQVERQVHEPAPPQ
jgi:hypothetical protein